MLILYYIIIFLVCERTKKQKTEYYIYFSHTLELCANFPLNFSTCSKKKETGLRRNRKRNAKKIFIILCISVSECAQEVSKFAWSHKLVGWLVCTFQVIFSVLLSILFIYLERKKKKPMYNQKNST